MNLMANGMNSYAKRIAKVTKFHCQNLSVHQYCHIFVWLLATLALCTFCCLLLLVVVSAIMRCCSVVVLSWKNRSGPPGPILDTKAGPAGPNLVSKIDHFWLPKLVQRYARTQLDDFSHTRAPQKKLLMREHIIKMQGLRSGFQEPCRKYDE